MKPYRHHLKVALLALCCAAALPAVADVYSTNVNQKINGGKWVEIGSFYFYGGTGEYIEISNEGASGYVIADAVSLTGNDVTNIIDNADLAPSQIYGSWALSKGGVGPYYGTEALNDEQTFGNPLKWVRFPVNVSQTGDYTVSLWWTSFGNRASNTSVKVVYNIESAIPEPHTLTVVNGSGAGSYLEGTEVQIEAIAPSDTGIFFRWSALAGTFDDCYAPVTRFIMPNENVTVTAAFREMPDALPPAQEALPPVRETARLLPVAAEVDVAVVGSSLGAIGTAVAAAQAGASVMLLCPNSYLGQDMAGENRYWLDAGEVPVSGLAQTLFVTRPSSDGKYYVTPGAFKQRAEGLLQSNNVAFLYGTYAVDTVVDANNDLSGIVIANKGGRQVVRAKVVVDATLMGGFAQTAGAAMEAWPSNTMATVSRTHYNYTSNSVDRYVEFTTRVSMPTGSWAERCRTETQLRNLFDDGTESWSAQYMHVAEPRGIIGEVFESAEPWIGAAAVDLGICKPHNLNYLYVIGQACSVSRTNAALLARPLEMLELGRRLGAAVQAVASARTRPTDLHVDATVSGSPSAGLDVAESLTGVRPFQQVQRIPQHERTLPVDGRYDVIVVGGGASGAPAAIGAARAGAKVLLIEQLGILGGTGVNGIGDLWHGYLHGFVTEFGKDPWRANDKAYYYVKKLEEAGVEVWLNTLGCGAIKSNNTVCGVVVATPMGRQAVLGKVVIDGTGDGDIYAWAGADFEFGCGKDGNFALQDSGFHGNTQDPYDEVRNNSVVFIDPGDIYNTTWFRVLSARHGSYAGMFDYYPGTGVRETRRLIGDYVITALDQYRKRTYADTICVANSNWDNHSFSKEKACYAGLFPTGVSYIPYRALLPRGLEGLLVVGRCKSTDHDALPIVRMQPDVANEGYAAGIAAAMCAEAGVALRNVDMPALQNTLCAVGNLPSTNICVDMPDPTDAELQTAIDNLSVTNSDGVSTSIAALLVNPARSIPLLRASFQAAPDEFKAKALCFCGDTNGVEHLAAWLNAQTGLGPDGTNPRVTPIDSAMRALGYTRDVRAIPALTNKLSICETSIGHYSHVRAAVLSLGDIGSPQAAPALLAFLQKPGATNLVRTVDQGKIALIGSPDYEAAVQEMIVAAALYRCGDTNGVAKQLLAAYLNDWRGPLRRFAFEMLSEKTTSDGIPYSWFEQHGIATNDYAAAESTDSDDDGASDWQEFWAGTDPRDDKDVFEINGLTRDGQLFWRGSTNSFGTPFRIYGSTNLASASPWTLTTTVPRAASGNNAWQLPEVWRQHPQLMIKLTAPTSD